MRISRILGVAIVGLVVVFSEGSATSMPNVRQRRRFPTPRKTLGKRYPLRAICSSPTGPHPCGQPPLDVNRREQWRAAPPSPPSMTSRV